MFSSYGYILHVNELEKETRASCLKVEIISVLLFTLVDKYRHTPPNLKITQQNNN